MSDPTVLTGVPPATMVSDTAAAALPPQTRASSTLVEALRDATVGFPEDQGVVGPYRPRLTLDWVGQPYVSAGFSRFGPTFGGGIAFLWSDMLGNHNLAAAIDVNTYGTRLSDVHKDTGGLIAYRNLTHRWDWGITAEQSPYVAGGFASGFGVADGQRVVVEQTIVQRQIFRSVGAMTARPFSQTRRVEFDGAYQQVSFDQQVRTTMTSVFTGRVIRDQTESSALAGPLQLGSTTAALVFDSAIFGATSPVAGGRSRFEVSPTFGTITFAGALADYRRYLMPVPFYTIATRPLHYGRYGSGSEDARLVPLFLGYPELVRGYGIGSFTPTECTATATRACVEFEPFGIRSSMYGPLPVEMALFADGGTAWINGDRPTFFGGDRRPVASAGVTCRASLFGFAVAQIDLARPFQRPGRGWVWGFSLNPGF